LQKVKFIMNFLSSIKNITTSLELATKLFVLIGLVAASVVVLPSEPVFATCTNDTTCSAPTSSSLVDKIREHCINVISSKAEAGCTDESATWARNVASYNCDDSQKAIDNGDAGDCMLKKANGYIDSVDKKNPSSPADFTNKLKDVLHTQKGKLDQINPKMTASSSEEQTTAAGTCRQTDGTCADCQNGGAGCVGGNPDPAVTDPGATCNRDGCDLVKKYVNPGINLLSIIFGLIAVISIILGGINYATSEDDPQKVSRAKDRIAKTVFAVVAYFFLYAFLQFLIPGGIF
jgi:hypothetical protein